MTPRMLKTLQLYLLQVRFAAPFEYRQTMFHSTCGYISGLSDAGAITEEQRSRAVDLCCNALTADLKARR